LTLTPALCVLILKREHHQPGRFFQAFNRGFDHLRGGYTGTVAWILRRGLIGAALFICMVVATVYLWRITPGSLVPDEDQGFYISAVILPDGSTLERTFKVVTQVEQAIRSNPNNLDIVAFTGFDFIGGGFRNNAATLFVTQKHWDERTVTAAQLVGEQFGKTMGIKEALVLAFNPPAIFGLGTAGLRFYIRIAAPATRKDAGSDAAFLGRANTDPQLGGRRALWRATVPQLSTSIARRRKSGVPIDDLFSAPAATLGTATSTTSPSTAVAGVMSADAPYRNRPGDMARSTALPRRRRVCRRSRR
jgi:HAE1 family hydrophobic/amphiphilic exporter-1/multidrug efflux pump